MPQDPLDSIEQLRIALDRASKEAGAISNDESVGKKEEEDFQRISTEDVEIQRKLLELEGLQQDITERRTYARRIFVLLVGWLLGVFAMLLFQAWTAWGFSLTEPLLISVVGGTTASVISIFIVVAKYLFPSGKNSS